MARALLVGCGCHGRALGARLLADGWAVRGTSRNGEGLELIRAAGIDAALADPDRVGTILDLVGDVGVVVWLMGSAQGSPDEIEAVNVLRLESLLEKLVDTPVRGFVFEGAGSVDDQVLAAGAALVERAARTWMIPVEIMAIERDLQGGWTDAMSAAVTSTLTGDRF